MNNLNKTKIICISGLIIAMYIVIMFATQHFAFGAYQIRIATALYSLSYLFPFLVLPLALANSLSNFLFGALGIFDIFGGFIVGIITAGGVYFVRRTKLPAIFIIPIIIAGPALIVPIWLSGLIGIPYFALVINLSIGQTIPAVVGYLLVKMLNKHLERMKLNG